LAITKAEAGLTCILSATFLLILIIFVYRSFYGMRIGPRLTSRPDVYSGRSI